MGGRMVWAALLGGLAVFAWGALAHLVLGLGMCGMRSAPGLEAPVRAGLKEHVKDAGIYFVPDVDKERLHDDAYKTALTERMRGGPVAFIVVKPDGIENSGPSPIQLARELANCVGLALIAVFLMVAAGGLSGLVARVCFCVLLALFGLMQTDLRMWNWYYFPGDFTASQFLEKCIGGVILGVVLHLFLKRR